MMELNADNYYTPEADREFMSCSQYQGWCECEAKQMAKLEGRWVEKPTEAFLVGNFFHSYFESAAAHEAFIAEHEDEIMTKRGELKAPYQQAMRMIEVAERDDLIRSLIEMPGENEIIMQGHIFGVPWRAKFDKYVPAGRMIIDWKTCANISELKWSDELHEKVTFIDAYGYMMRAAVYSELEKQVAHSGKDPYFVIVALSKQDYPDKEVLSLNHRQRWDYELEQIKPKLAHIQRIREGHEKPRRCGACDYCRATKKLFEIKPYYVLMPEFREAREDDVGTGTLLADTQAAGELDNVPVVRSAIAVGP